MTVTDEREPRRGRRVAADDRQAVGRARRVDAVVERLGALDGHVVGQAERDRRVERVRVHGARRPHGRRDGLPADHAERRVRAVEVDALDERVSRDDVHAAGRDAVDRAVVADALDRARRGARRARRACDPVDEAELADLGDGGERLRVVGTRGVGHRAEAERGEGTVACPCTIRPASGGAVRPRPISPLSASPASARCPARRGG